MSAFLILLMLQPCVCAGGVQESGIIHSPGMLTVTEWNKNDLISLSGIWDFYWNVLYLDEEELLQAIPPRSIPFFDSWHIPSEDGDILPVFGYGTYRLQIQLPPEAPENMMIRIPIIDAAAALFCNGELVFSNGTVGTTRETTRIAYHRPTISRLDVKDGKLDLYLQIANFQSRTFSFSVAPIIGEDEKFYVWNSISVGIEAAIIAIIFTTILYHLLVSRIILHEFQLYLFGLTSLAAIAYLLVNGSSFAGQSGVPWVITFKTHNISRLLMVYFFFRYTQFFFSVRLSKWKDRTLRISAAAVIIFYLLSPISVISDAYYISLAAVYTVGVFTLIVSVRASLEQQEYARTFILSILFIYGMIFLDQFSNSDSWPVLFNCRAASTVLILGVIQAIVIRKKLYQYFIKTDKLIENRTSEIEFLLNLQSRHASIGEMLNFIAHQWQQNLFSISLSVKAMQLALDSAADRELLHQRIELINANNINMTTTLRNFREFLDPSRSKVLFNVREAFHEILWLMQDLIKVNGITVKEKEPEGISEEINGYKNEFKQVLMNLITNAVSIMETRKVKNPQIFFSVLDSADSAVSVIFGDNGGGFPSSHEEIIFQKYFTTNAKSSGLGLYLSRKIIEEHFMGTLTAENGKEGALFKVTIKIAGMYPDQSRT